MQVGAFQCGKGPANLVLPHSEESMDIFCAYAYLVLIGWKKVFSFSSFVSNFLLLGVFFNGRETFLGMGPSHCGTS